MFNSISNERGILQNIPSNELLLLLVSSATNVFVAGKCLPVRVCVCVCVSHSFTQKSLHKCWWKIINRKLRVKRQIGFKRVSLGNFEAQIEEREWRFEKRLEFCFDILELCIRTLNLIALCVKKIIMIMTEVTATEKIDQFWCDAAYKFHANVVKILWCFCPFEILGPNNSVYTEPLRRS